MDLLRGFTAQRGSYWICNQGTPAYIDWLGLRAAERNHLGDPPHFSIATGRALSTEAFGRSPSSYSFIF
jgi:hypothetical protein